MFSVYILLSFPPSEFQLVSDVSDLFVDSRCVLYLDPSPFILKFNALRDLAV